MPATVDTNLYYADRLNSSVNGNPRFTLATADGSFITQSDAACSYDVENTTRPLPHGGSARIRLHLTRAGRVWNIERL